ncbi:hypothetical protein evm_008204 [Chilo suppressalis]|nr:hypothetical protein evm_008204 [Chilo suppressalis]
MERAMLGVSLKDRIRNEPINVPTAGAQAFPMDGIGRLGHDPPRGPSADWWVLTTADAAGTNGLTCLPKHGGARDSDKPEIQKTRSEETLSVPSLLDIDIDQFKAKTYAPYSEAEDTFTPLYDGNYTRYDYDCSFADRYSLLPPIGTRTDSEASVQEGDGDRILSSSILMKGTEDEAAILEECLDGTVEECRLRQADSPQLAAKNLAPIPAAEYGPLVGGWRASRFGSAGGLGGGGGCVARAPPLSCSTPDLPQLARHRILPALSRHRNREHLHLSDEGLDSLSPPPPVERRQRRIQRIAERPPEPEVSGDREHLHLSDEGLDSLSPPPPVERRQRRIQRIAERPPEPEVSGDREHLASERRGPGLAVPAPARGAPPAPHTAHRGAPARARGEWGPGAPAPERRGPGLAVPAPARGAPPAPHTAHRGAPARARGEWGPGAPGV